MASERDKRELIEKVTRLVSSRYGGTGADAWRRAFDSFDTDEDGRIDADELGALLEQAGIGNAFTRGAWTSGVMTEINTSGTGKISFAELMRVVRPDDVSRPVRKNPRPVDTTPMGKPTAVVDVYGPRRGPPDEPAPDVEPAASTGAGGTIIVLVLLGLALALRYGR